MSFTVSDLPTKEMLHVLDPDLPFLASEAAIDIENLLSNRSHDLQAIQRLAKQLKSSISRDINGVFSCSSMDVATLAVLGEVIAETMRDSSLNTINILDKASEIADALLQEDLTNNRSQLEQARDFCVALSRVAVAYNKSIRDLHLLHPFRR